MEKKREFLGVEILQDGTIFLKEKESIIEDGVEIHAKILRNCFYPTKDLEGLNENLKKHAEIVWTDEVVNAYEQKKADAHQVYLERMKAKGLNEFGR